MNSQTSKRLHNYQVDQIKDALHFWPSWNLHVAYTVHAANHGLLDQFAGVVPSWDRSTGAAVAAGMSSYPTRDDRPHKYHDINDIERPWSLLFSARRVLISSSLTAISCLSIATSFLSNWSAIGEAFYDRNAVSTLLYGEHRKILARTVLWENEDEE